jgi:5S rRNA maturation endonuclease (ribonuclease M5)
MTWILQLYHDFNIPYVTEGDRHATSGWANTSCPFCGPHPNPHLGVNIESGTFNCWRCGPHKTSETIAALIGVSEQQARAIIARYQQSRTIHRKVDTNKKIKMHTFKHPPGTAKFDELHISYLEKRNFDPLKLQLEWNLCGTGPVSFLDKIDYRFRILAPIYWDNREVSFQTRDCTDKSTRKYLACPKNRETIHHKEIVYGKGGWWGDVAICVEGITDVWRLGPKAFATFGIQFSSEQVRLIGNTFKRVIVLYDNDRPAQKQAKLLAAKLRAASNISVHVERLANGDPAEMKQDDADHLVRNLTRRLV